jgi:hypothetical protein
MIHMKSQNSPKHVEGFICTGDLLLFINCVHSLVYMAEYEGKRSLGEPRHRWEKITDIMGLR